MNPSRFQKRLRSLYKIWFKHRAKLWGGAEVLVVSTATGVPSPKSEAFYFWLLGYNLPSTTAVFTPLHIYFVCTGYKKSSQLEALQAAAFMAVGADLTVRTAFGTYHADHLDEVLRTVIGQTQREVATCSAVITRRRCAGERKEEDQERKNPVISAGCIADEPPKWKFDFEDNEAWCAWRRKKLAARGFDLVWKDATLGFSMLARIKGGRQAAEVLGGGETKGMDGRAAVEPVVLEEDEEEEEGVADEVEGSRSSEAGSLRRGGEASTLRGCHRGGRY